MDSRDPVDGRSDVHQEALVQWMTRSQGWLYGHILTLLPDPEAAKDVLQQTNLVLWRKRQEYDPGQAFLGWAAAIAHFQVLAHRRDRSRDRHAFGAAVLDQLASETVADGEIDAPGCREQALRSCLGKLGESDRTLVLQRYSPGHTVQTMAAELGKSVNAVSRALYRIRGLLADCIERALPGERA